MVIDGGLVFTEHHIPKPFLFKWTGTPGFSFESHLVYTSLRRTFFAFPCLYKGLGSERRYVSNLCPAIERWTGRNTWGISPEITQAAIEGHAAVIFHHPAASSTCFKVSLARNPHVPLVFSCWGVRAAPSCLWNGISPPLLPDLALELRYALEPFKVELGKHHKRNAN